MKKFFVFALLSYVSLACASEPRVVRSGEFNVTIYFDSNGRKHWSKPTDTDYVQVNRTGGQYEIIRQGEANRVHVVVAPNTTIQAFKQNSSQSCHFGTLKEAIEFLKQV